MPLILEPFTAEEAAQITERMAGNVETFDRANQALTDRNYFLAAQHIQELLEAHEETLLGLRHMHRGIIAEVQKAHGG